MTELKKPVLSPRFDVEDIQKLREYNSLRHIQMTSAEIVEETRAATSDIVAKLIANGNVTIRKTHGDVV